MSHRPIATKALKRAQRDHHLADVARRFCEDRIVRVGIERRTISGHRYARAHDLPHSPAVAGVFAALFSRSRTAA